MAWTTDNTWSLAQGVVTSPPLTMFCRFKVATLSDRTFMQLVNVASTTGWSVYIFSGALGATQARGPGTSDFVTAGAAPTTGAWTSLMFVATDQFNFYLGVNGANFGHTNAGGSMPAAPNSTVIGCGGTAADVCEFAIWNVALFDAFPGLHKGADPRLFAARNLVLNVPMVGRYDPEICLINGPLTLDGGTPTYADHPPTYRARHRDMYAHLTYSVPATDFTMAPTTGTGPLSVSGTDATLMGPSRSWLWERNSGSGYSTFSTDKNPSGISFTTGIWDIRLTTGNPAGSDAEEKLDFVKVGAVPPPPSSVIAMGLGAGL